MIIGVTHDQDGRVVQRLSVSTKVSIGLPPNGDRNHPTKLDHFVFLRKKKTPRGVEWEPDPELTEHYGAECRELHIMLIDDDVENVFPSSYAWWAATERKCWGDGTSATRRTAEKPGGEPWTPCGNGCPELASGLCKPSGDLRFVLADFPRLGSVCRIHTSSYRSIRQIHSALQEIQTFTGGRLAGITGKLVVRPEEITYFDRKEKRKKTTSVWVLSLEVEGEDMRKLIANLTENARLFAETRKLLGPGGKVFEVVEEEQEQAPEINGEFYPPPTNGSPGADGNGNGSVPASAAEHVPGSGNKNVPPASATLGPGNDKAGTNGTAKPATGQPASPAAPKNDNGSASGNGLNQLRNEFLMTARRIATATKRPIGDVIEQATGGGLKYGDIGRLTEADVPKLRAAIEQLATPAGPAAH
jgi:Recombination directionality factor-like